MKRVNTADPTMVRELAELKKQGITDFICHAFNEEKSRWYKPVIKHTAQGISAYANQMYNKHGDNVAVYVSYFDNDLNMIDYCKFHA